MKANISLSYPLILFGADLKLFFSCLCNFQGTSSLRVSYEYWQDLVCIDPVVRSMNKLFANLYSLSWRLGCVASVLLGAVSRYGLCPIDLARELARHRSNFGSQLQQVAPHEILPKHLQHLPGRCQPVSRLAHLFRLGRCSDPPCAQALFGRGFEARVQELGLRFGCHHHRSVSEFVRLDTVHKAKVAVKFFTLLELIGSIPVFIHIYFGKMHEVNALYTLLQILSVSELEKTEDSYELYVDSNKIDNAGNSKRLNLLNLKSDTTI
jgi:hypothetical protein